MTGEVAAFGWLEFLPWTTTDERRELYLEHAAGS